MPARHLRTALPAVLAALLVGLPAPVQATTATEPGIDTRVGVDGVAVIATLPSGASSFWETRARVYRDGTLVGEAPFDADSKAVVVDTTVPPGGTATYTATSVHEAVESGPSPTATATVPDRPAPAAGQHSAVAVSGPEPTNSGLTTSVHEFHRPGRLAVSGHTSSGSLHSMSLTWDHDLAPGTYESTPDAPAPVRASVSGPICWQATSRVDVTESAVRADGTPLVVSATLRMSCPAINGSPARELGGELRWRSSRGYVAATFEPEHVDVGTVPVGSTRRAELQYRNVGTEVLTVGAADLTSQSASSFRLAGTTCPQTLPAGSSCTVLLDVTPDSSGTRTAAVSLADSTARGATTGQVRALADGPPAAPYLVTAAAAVGRVRVKWTQVDPAPYDTIVAYDVWRAAGTSPAVLVGSVEGTVLPRYDDRTAQVGQRYTYAVSARSSSKGSSARTAAAPLLVPDREVLYGGENGGHARLAAPGARPVEDDRVEFTSISGSPSVSADGARLVFPMQPYAGPGLFVSAADGTGLRRLTSGGVHLSPRFSRDGSRVYFAQTTSQYREFMLMVVPFAGGTPVAVPGGEGVMGLSVVDARTAVVTLRAGDATSLARLDLVTGARTPLAGTSRVHGPPVVSRDGRRIAWTRMDATVEGTRDRIAATSVQVGPVTGGTWRQVPTSFDRPFVSDWTVGDAGVLVTFSVDDWQSDIGEIALADGRSTRWTSTSHSEFAPVLRLHDRTVPSLRLTYAPGRATTAPSMRLAWTAADAAAGVASFDVRVRRARHDRDYAPWSAPVSTPTAATTQALPAGHDTCVEVRARDRHGNLSPWQQRCVSRPVDERSLTASSGWTRTARAGAYGGTVTATRRSGATLTLPASRAVRGWLVADRCPTCGAVDVLVSGRLVGTVSLRAASPQRSALLPLPGAGVLRAGPLVLRTRGTAPVTVDGVALARS